MLQALAPGVLRSVTSPASSAVACDRGYSLTSLTEHRTQPSSQATKALYRAWLAKDTSSAIKLCFITPVPLLLLYARHLSGLSPRFWLSA